jgi:hypothetical protein
MLDGDAALRLGNAPRCMDWHDVHRDIGQFQLKQSFDHTIHDLVGISDINGRD